jgi:hypothetical protein
MVIVLEKVEDHMHDFLSGSVHKLRRAKKNLNICDFRHNSYILSWRTPQPFEVSQPNLVWLLRIRCSRTALLASHQGVSINYAKQLCIIGLDFIVIYGHPLIGSKYRGPRASHSQQPYQVFLRYLKRLWSSGSGNPKSQRKIKTHFSKFFQIDFYFIINIFFDNFFVCVLLQYQFFSNF